MTKKSMIDTSDANPAKSLTTNQIRQSSPIHTTGVNLGHRPDEPNPNFNQAPVEKIIKNHYNAWIVLGKDRPGGLSSGKGGAGHTHCASIDLVVGRPTHGAKNGEKVSVDPVFRPQASDDSTEEIPFASDSARIYISQKTDLEANFGLAGGSHGPSLNRSGIGVKADRVALMGQEGIKIVTGIDKFNSMGGETITQSGIDLIAMNPSRGNHESLEPLVKGERLAELLSEIVGKMQDLDGIVIGIINSLVTLSIDLQNHVHASPFYGMPTTTPWDFAAPYPGIPAIAPYAQFSGRLLGTSAKSIVNHTSNLQNLVSAYISDEGARYINSRHNKTT